MAAVAARVAGCGRRRWLALAAAAGLWTGAAPAADEAARTVERIRPSIVAVGTMQATRQPQFRFYGTGFAVGDGTLVATNAHVIPRNLEYPSGQVILSDKSEM